MTDGTTTTKRNLDDLPAPTQAGILCNDLRFQTFAATRCGAPGSHFTPSAAAEYLRNICGITSRRELKTDARARQRLAALRTEFDAWTGKIPSQR